MKKHTLYAAFFFFTVAVLPFSGRGETAEKFSPYVDAKGNISLPKGFREKWSHLGSWATEDPHSKRIGTHDVYTQQSSVAAFKKSGEFPDGAVLVKEIRKGSSAKLTAGQTTWGVENDIWFVMIKDTKNRFPKNPLWDEGWGWALFEAKNPEKNIAPSFRLSCFGCHVPAQSTDWVFIQGYPTLRKDAR